MPSFLNLKKIIKVGIDGGDFVPFSNVHSGIQRLVDSTLKGLMKRRYKNLIFNYYYFGEKLVKKEVEYLNFVRVPRRGFSTFFLPIFFKRDDNDVFLGFSSFFSPLLNSLARKKIIFLYDLGFIKNPKFYSKAELLKKKLYFSVKNTDKIITLSHYVKNEIISQFENEVADKIEVIYPGLDHLNSIKDKESDQKINFKYFLFVGVIKPGKNIKSLFQVFFRFIEKKGDKNYRLLLIGNKETDYYRELLVSPEYQKIKEKVVFLKNVTDQELIGYYQKAEAVLNLSCEEGFGFPVFEALSLGKKVIVNNLPIYQEFKKIFEQLYIGQNGKEIVFLMNQVTKIKNKPLSKNIFKWKNFVDQLIKIIVDFS